jgi:hypothetical protein
MKAIRPNKIRTMNARESCFRETLKGPSDAAGIRKGLIDKRFPELVAAHWRLDSLLRKLGCLRIYLPEALHKLAVVPKCSAKSPVGNNSPGKRGSALAILLLRWRGWLWGRLAKI